MNTDAYLIVKDELQKFLKEQEKLLNEDLKELGLSRQEFELLVNLGSTKIH
jgi:hypothetical protein